MERPFFDQARPVYLEPLSDPDLGDYIAAHFHATGRESDEALEPLLDLVAGHPQRAMLCAHHLWEQTPARHSADLEAWETAEAAALREAADALQVAWDMMPITRRRVLAALASSAEPLLANNTLRAFGLAKTTAAEARGRLVWSGDVSRIGNDLQIVDPLLAHWARHRIPYSDRDTD